MKLVIINGTIVNSGHISGKMDIFIENGVVAGIAEKIDPKSLGHTVDVIDASGLTILPGLIDAHCHLRDPGFEYKEDIETGTASAALGGFTAVACMPNTEPAADNAQTIRYIIDKAKNEGHVKVFPIGSVTKGLRGSELSEIGDLKFSGAIAVSDDGRPVANPAMMKKAMLYAKAFEIPVISHCEDLDLADDGDMYEGLVSLELGLRGIPYISESVQAARDVLICEYTESPLHIAHVSTEATVNIIRAAKKRGVNVTCETCPHYFTLTADACRGYDTNAKVAPPLALASDVAAIIAGLADGTIDVIATDHAPHHADEKNVEFQRAARGIAGFETAFGLAYTYLVLPGYLSLGQLVEKMSVNPARLFKLDASGAGTLKVGGPADLTIVDLENEYIAAPENFRSKGKNSPFGGFFLKGSVMYTIIDGVAVVRQGVLID